MNKLEISIETVRQILGWAKENKSEEIELLDEVEVIFENQSGEEISVSANIYEELDKLLICIQALRDDRDQCVDHFVSNRRG